MQPQNWASQLVRTGADRDGDHSVFALRNFWKEKLGRDEHRLSCREILKLSAS